MQCNTPVASEVLNVVLAANITPDRQDDTQLLQAIQALAGNQALTTIAAGAGYFSMMGKISAAGAVTLDIPEGSVNIGGNGKGYMIAAQSSWDVSDATNHDGSLGTLVLGDDVYIYAVDDGDIQAKLVASKNADIPDGYTAVNSRKIGGFHYGRVRPVVNRYDTDYIPSVQIVPNSVWDLQHRPSCDPTGMVEITPGGFWADIYLNSEGGGIWPENVPVSRYGQSLIRNNVYARSDFHLLLRNAGKRLPTVEEFLTYAEGAPAGENNNTFAWTATTNAGPTTAGNVDKAVSMFNVVDAVGNLWDYLDDHLDWGGTFSKDTSVVNVGKDAAIPRGAVEHADWSNFAGGGAYGYSVSAGARCLHSGSKPWFTNGVVGLRGVCGAL
ncbi:hypothetical protein [Thalassospira alkalitolerans]|uniref:phage major tropism determinant n=1 Tax=Thalassospira alkalitolerans TaxID=1293890 RepID=UPI0030EF0D02|tara:strand:+ start:16183 stop:17331 length:1149 start_codon:yes stop_codon:yes gene_type:complete